MARAAKKMEITAGYDWLKNHAPWTTAQATFAAFVEHKLDEEPLALFAWGDWIPERFFPVVAVPPPPYFIGCCCRLDWGPTVLSRGCCWSPC